MRVSQSWGERGFRGVGGEGEGLGLSGGGFISDLFDERFFCYFSWS